MSKIALLLSFPVVFYYFLLNNFEKIYWIEVQRTRWQILKTVKTWNSILTKRQQYHHQNQNHPMQHKYPDRMDFLANLKENFFRHARLARYDRPLGRGFPLAHESRPAPSRLISPITRIASGGCFARIRGKHRRRKKRKAKSCIIQQITGFRAVPSTHE